MALSDERSRELWHNHAVWLTIDRTRLLMSEGDFIAAARTIYAEAYRAGLEERGCPFCGLSMPLSEDGMWHFFDGVGDVPCLKKWLGQKGQKGGGYDLEG
jgi:hypothetical protein